MNEKATNKLSEWEESTPSKGRLSPFINGGGDLVSVDIGPSPCYSIVIEGENFTLTNSAKICLYFDLLDVLDLYFLFLLNASSLYNKI